MKNKDLSKRNIVIALFIYFGLLTILLVTMLSSQFLLLIPVWGAISTYVWIKTEARVVLKAAILYPLIESVLKSLIVWNVYPGSWEVLNRIEHLVGAAFITFILFHLYTKLIDWKGRYVLLYLFTFTSIVTLGLLNEQFEAIVRIYFLELNNEYYGPLYYRDTFWDNLSNISASAIVIVLFWWKSYLIYKE